MKKRYKVFALFVLLSSSNATAAGNFHRAQEWIRMGQDSLYETIEFIESKLELPAICMQLGTVLSHYDTVRGEIADQGNDELKKAFHAVYRDVWQVRGLCGGHFKGETFEKKGYLKEGDLDAANRMLEELVTNSNELMRQMKANI